MFPIWGLENRFLFLKFQKFHLDSKDFKLSISVVVDTDFFVPLPSRHLHTCVNVGANMHAHTQIDFLTLEVAI